MDAATRLWLPPLVLAGCVRAVMLRDTRGRALDAAQRENFFPATPLVSLFWWIEGGSEWLATPGFSVPPDEPRTAPVMFGGPFTLPSHTRNPGAIRAFKLLLLPDAFMALTGVALDRHVNQIRDARDVLPADWQDWAVQMSAAPDDAARLTLLQDFLVPRWQALGAQRPAQRRYADWTEALAVRAATSAAGRSLRQLERRIKAWAGLPMRELRAVSRAENAFHAVAAAEGGGVNWAHIAASSDYADQSHLCRETRRLTGFSPEDLRRRIATEEAFWAYRLWRD